MPTGQRVNENETVINSVPTFFAELAHLLNSTSTRTVANYMLWRVVHSVAEGLPSDFRSIQWDASELHVVFANRQFFCSARMKY